MWALHSYSVVDLFDVLSPHARLATAVLPFVVALGLRIILGRNRLTRTLVSAGTVWFFINVLMAPYSTRMRQEIENLQHIIR